MRLIHPTMPRINDQPSSVKKSKRRPIVSKVRPFLQSACRIFRVEDGISLYGDHDALFNIFSMCASNQSYSCLSTIMLKKGREKALALCSFNAKALISRFLCEGVTRVNNYSKICLLFHILKYFGYRYILHGKLSMQVTIHTARKRVLQQREKRI